MLYYVCIILPPPPKGNHCVILEDFGVFCGPQNVRFLNIADCLRAVF